MAVYYTEEEPSFLEQMLSSGLQSYQQKRQQTQQGQALGSLSGLTEEQSRLLSSLPPEMQQAYVSNLTKSNIADQKNVTKQNEQQQLMQLMGLTGQETMQEPIQEPIQEQGQGNLMQMLGLGEQEQIQEPVQQPIQDQFNLGQSLGIEQQQPATQQPTQPQAKRYTQEEINTATLLNPNVGRTMQAQNDAIDKQIERKATLHNKANETYFANISSRAEILPQKESALNSMVDAIDSGDLGFFSKDNLANLTGVEGLRTGKGAQFISAGKEYFLGSLKRAGARPNEWIEQQIQKMLPQIGRSKEANLTVAELLKMENEIEKKQIDLTYDMADELEKTLGYVPRDLPQRVLKQMKPFADEQQKLLEGRLREISGEVKTGKTQNNIVDKLPKTANGKSMDASTAKKILAKAGGDPAKATELARKEGYDI